MCTGYFSEDDGPDLKQSSESQIKSPYMVRMVENMTEDCAHS